VYDGRQHSTDVAEDGRLVGRPRELGPEQRRQMDEHVGPGDDAVDGLGAGGAGARRQDAGQRARRVHDARRVVVGPLHGRYQTVDEPEHTALRRRPIQRTSHRIGSNHGRINTQLDDKSTLLELLMAVVQRITYNIFV